MERAAFAVAAVAVDAGAFAVVVAGAVGDCGGGAAADAAAGDDDHPREAF